MTETFQELRTRAKAAGINTFQKGRAAIEAELDALSSPPVQGHAESAAAHPPRGERAPDRKPKGRRRRIPMGTPELKLTAPKRDGYHRHWFNDHRGRIKRAENSDYTFVYEDRERVSRLVGVKDDGSPMYAFLMEIPEDLYREDQAAKQAPIDEFDRQLRSATKPKDSDPRDEGRFYRPDA